jgi:hypothetical protein
MKIKELIEKLNKLNQEGQIVVSSDEELNTLYDDFEVSELGEDAFDESQVYVIFGLSGSERGE